MSQTSGYPIIGDKVPNPCEEPLDLVAFFPGTTTAVPVIELGNLVLRGAVTPYSSEGIGMDGRSTNEEFRIPFSAILRGGAGVKKRTVTTPDKKKLRMRVLASDACSINSGLLSLRIRPVSTCASPNLHEEILPVVIAIDNCVGTDEKKARAAAAAAALIPYNPTEMTVVQIGTGWYIEIEAKDSKTNFRIESWENLEAPTEVTPYSKGGFQAKLISHNFKTPIIGDCDPEKYLPALQIFFEAYVPFKGEGATTSNPAQSAEYYIRQLRSITVLYDPTITNSNNANTALEGLMTNSDQMLKRMASTTSEDLINYAFTIVRIDAGDASALSTADGVYNVAGKTGFTRAAFLNGKSVYILKKTNLTAITPDGNGSNPDDTAYFGYVKPADVV